MSLSARLLRVSRTTIRWPDATKFWCSERESADLYVEQYSKYLTRSTVKALQAVHPPSMQTLESLGLDLADGFGVYAIIVNTLTGNADDNKLYNGSSSILPEHHCNSGYGIHVRLKQHQHCIASGS